MAYGSSSTAAAAAHAQSWPRLATCLPPPCPPNANSLFLVFLIVFSIFFLQGFFFLSSGCCQRHFSSTPVQCHAAARAGVMAGTTTSAFTSLAAVCRPCFTRDRDSGTLHPALRGPRTFEFIAACIYRECLCFALGLVCFKCQTGWVNTCSLAAGCAQTALLASCP